MRTSSLPAALCCLVALVPRSEGRALAAEAAQAPALYALLPGEVTLDNEQVRVERFRLAPGQSTGAFRPHGDQLLVFIRGGVLASKATGRATLWRDGRVAWHAAAEPGDEGVTNTGPAAVDFL